MVHLQHKAIGQGIASADLPDQGLTDDLCFQFIKQFLVDGALDLLPRKPASGLEAEDIVVLPPVSASSRMRTVGCTLI